MWSYHSYSWLASQQPYLSINFKPELLNHTHTHTDTCQCALQITHLHFLRHAKYVCVCVCVCKRAPLYSSHLCTQPSSVLLWVQRGYSLELSAGWQTRLQLLPSLIKSSSLSQLRCDAIQFHYLGFYLMFPPCMHYICLQILSSTLYYISRLCAGTLTFIWLICDSDPII